MSIPGSEAVEVPVLIVGAGPAGLALSVALSRHGVEHLVVERHRGTAHTPRAHIIDQRTVEILRHLGISDRFHAVATPQHLMANNLWVTTLAGLEVARSETWGTSAVRAADYRTASPEPMANCPQTVLEPMLLAAARDAGADVRFGWEFNSLAQDQDGVTSVVRQRDGEATLTVRSRYVVGADGARSRVLGQAGLTAEGPDDLAQAANIWFRADLSRYLAHRPGVLSTLYEPGPTGDERRNALGKAIELSNYQFNAHGIELGYRYRSDAIVDDGTPDPTPTRDPQLYYQPTTRPGARVPHARLEQDGIPVSSLDLVDDLGFALLTGVGGEAWAQAAAEISARAGVTVRVHVIGRREGVTDPYGEWASRREVETAGCVLVRPDRHVAWRSMRYTPDSARQLPAVIEQALGRPG